MGKMPLYQRINWVSTIALVTTPILAVYSFFKVPLCWQTALWSVIYYFVTGFGITAGKILPVSFMLPAPRYLRSEVSGRCFT